MRRLWVFFFSIPLFAAALVPGRYIVTLSGESVARYIARTVPPGQRRQALLGEAGQRYRGSLRLTQSAVRRRLEGRGARVIGAVNTVANAMFVSVPADRVTRLGRVPGVVGVSPVRTYNLTLDHALPLHKIPEAWSLGGAYPQGAGVKIGMLDTGIDITHPGFNDAGFQAPAGFPKLNDASDAKFTNQKVIVARSYVSQFLAPDPDDSAQDDVGHGTGTSMAAGGVQNTGPLATITGAAPQAYLGSYKIFGSPGVNDSTTEDAILQAIDDAVTDGMDVINLSVGSPLAVRVGNDTEVSGDPLHLGVEGAVTADVMVVISAGNSGPDPNTISSPGTAPSAITVGASNNDRFFAAPFTVGTNGPYPAILAAELLPAIPVTASLIDISLSLDSTGLACGTLPAGSLTGKIALILRGTCTFEVKLNNAQQAGAIAALVYTDASRPDAIVMAVGSATLPAEMVSNQDGVTIKQLASKPVSATMSFSQAAFAVNPNSIAAFSSRGPNVDLGIKPDLLAVGENFYTAAERVDSVGELFSADGYVVSQGTSFSSPLVAGAAAVLKAARPGFTALQYKSLLVNSTAPAFPGQAQFVQNGGAGLLDLSAAVRSTLAVEPTSISFGVGSGTAHLSSSVRLSNLGYASENFLISVVPSGNSPAPVPAAASVSLASDTYADVALTLTASGLPGGEYEGFIAIQGSISGIQTRIPYWYGVASSSPAHITVLSLPGAAPAAGSSVQGDILFRITDSSGIVVSGVTPKATVTAGGGSVIGVNNEDAVFPGVWDLDVRMGPTSGAANTFQITAGSITATLTITAK